LSTSFDFDLLNLKEFEEFDDSINEILERVKGLDDALKNSLIKHEEFEFQIFEF